MNWLEILTVTFFYAASCAAFATLDEDALADLKRAWTKVPGDHVRGADHGEMTGKLNAQLRITDGLKHKPCEEFTVQELMAVQKVFFQARDPKFQAIYEKTQDNRRLMAFGKLVKDLETLEVIWEEELELLKAHPTLHNVTRDAKCHEAVMWYVHHVPVSKRIAVMASTILPLLPEVGCPHSKAAFENHAPTPVIEKVFEGYKAGIGCAACHASGQTAKNKEYTEWPEELEYFAAGHGAFPFWDNGGPGCSHCNPSIDGTSHLRVQYSSKLNAEILMHEACGDMSWTGGENYPNKSPCNSHFSTEGAFIYTPKAALQPEADGKFCCRMYNAKDSQFPGAVPRDWMKSMKYEGTKSGFKGDYYSGDVKIYTYTISPPGANATSSDSELQPGGLEFWYFESPDGLPVEQGEGCYQPGVKAKRACSKMMPIVLYHDFNQSSFKSTTYTAEDFAVPDVCKTTTIKCSAPGGD